MIKKENAHDQDYQVLILEVGPGKVYPCGLQLKRHVEVGQIKAVIPLSVAAHTHLQFMLPAIPWKRPLFEAAFQQEDERRQMERARMGGQAFLSLLGTATDSLPVRQRCQQIETALARPKEDPPADFLQRLLQFASSTSVFKSDVDYIHHLGTLLNGGSNSALRESLSKRIQGHRGGALGLVQLLSLFSDLRDALSQLTDSWYLSSLIFLKLKNEIENAGGRYQGLSSWALELQKLEPAAFAEAALLTGYHFKFQAFSDSYWTHTIGSTSPEPASVQPGLIVKEPALPQIRVGQPEAQAPPSDQKIIKQWLTYAASLGRQGRFDEAVHALQRVVEEDPRSLEVRHALIQFALQKGDFATVIYQHMDCAELCILNDNTQCAIGHYDAILGMEESVITPPPTLTQRQVVAAADQVLHAQAARLHVSFSRRAISALKSYSNSGDRARTQSTSHVNGLVGSVLEARAST